MKEDQALKSEEKCLNDTQMVLQNQNNINHTTS